ncbi:MAG: hypothetical protein QM811_19540 [Pirellulales bacterium]
MPLGCEIGGRILRFEATQVEAMEFQSLREPTLAPGRSGLNLGNLELPLGEPSLSPSSRLFSQEQQLLAWLQASMEVFQSAGGSNDFLPKAAQAAATLIHLDQVAVIQRTPDAWNVLASCSAEGEIKDNRWRPSSTMLRRVQEECRTFYHAPKFETSEVQSLVDIHSIVAAPILNVKGQLIGAVRRAFVDLHVRYRRQHQRVGSQAVRITRLRRGVGPRAQEQERKLIAERVRFEQFFSPELARMLESQGESMLAARRRDHGDVLRHQGLQPHQRQQRRGDLRRMGSRRAERPVRYRRRTSRRLGRLQRRRPGGDLARAP